MEVSATLVGDFFRFYERAELFQKHLVIIGEDIEINSLSKSVGILTKPADIYRQLIICKGIGNLYKFNI
jgi:hypothetical protein